MNGGAGTPADGGGDADTGDMETAPARTRSVLIVDDQQAYLDAERLVVDLTDGFEVVATATSGEDAVDAVATHAPDLVLMDVNLPGIDGFEATRRIMAAAPATQVLVVSTYSGEDYGAAAAAAGAVGFVSKGDLGPDDLDRLR